MVDVTGGVWNVASSCSREGNRASADTSPEYVKVLGFEAFVGLGFRGEEVRGGAGEYCEGRGDGDGRGAEELGGLDA